jgi:hypothetical protein
MSDALSIVGSSALTAGGYKLYGDLTRDEQRCLFARCMEPGPHVDIGTHFGGSAHTAAVAKGGTGHVYSLECSEEYVAAARKSLSMFMPDWENRITIIETQSQLWTPPEKPATVFIDGNHSFKGCFVDWLTYSAITSRYILFHDTDLNDVKQVLVAADNDQNWRLIERVDKIAVYERVGDANKQRSSDSQ